MGRTKKEKLSKDDKELFDDFSEEEKKKYLKLSYWFYISLYIMLIPFLLLIEVMMFGGESVFDTIMTIIGIVGIGIYIIIEIINFLKMPQNQKIINYYKTFNSVHFTDMEHRLLMWLAIVCVAIFTIAPFVYSCINGEFNIFLLLVMFSGIYTNFVIWASTLRNK
jgi:hypothetical protein